MLSGKLLRRFVGSVAIVFLDELDFWPTGALSMVVKDKGVGHGTGNKTGATGVGQLSRSRDLDLELASGADFLSHRRGHPSDSIF